MQSDFIAIYRGRIDAPRPANWFSLGLDLAGARGSGFPCPCFALRNCGQGGSRPIPREVCSYFSRFFRGNKPKTPSLSSTFAHLLCWQADDQSAKKLCASQTHLKADGERFIYWTWRFERFVAAFHRISSRAAGILRTSRRGPLVPPGQNWPSGELSNHHSRVRP